MQGRPELSYNLGNSLIRQKRYDQALQSLRQAIGKGDKGLQAKAWYNAGNALYADGNFKDAAHSYIESLHLDAADREAKHNLELALRKLEEQKEQQKGQGQKQDQNQQKSDNQKKQDQAQNQPKQQDQQQSRDQEKSENRQAQREGSISKERALQILDAMKNQELADQRKLLERQARPKASPRDW